MVVWLVFNGWIMGWSVKIVVFVMGVELVWWLMFGVMVDIVVWLLGGDCYVVVGVLLFYVILVYVIDYYVVDIGVLIGYVWGGVYGYIVFFNECFFDELVYVVGLELMLYWIGMFGGGVCFVWCLLIVVVLGGWEGGVLGSG